MTREDWLAWDAEREDVTEWLERTYDDAPQSSVAAYNGPRSRENANPVSECQNANSNA